MPPRSPVSARSRRILVPLLTVGLALATAAALAPTAGATTSRPAVPTGFGATVASSGTSLHWTRRAVSSYAIEQATTSSFRGARTYRVRWNAGSFTPFGMTRGRTYYFRIGALQGSAWSGWSKAIAVRPATAMQLVRVMTYNTLAASFDYRREGDGRVAGWYSRRPGQVYLIKASNADAIAIQEGSSCLIHYKSKPCWREVDSLRLQLGSGYGLANTDSGPKGRYSGEYIIYKKSVLTPRGSGGNWGLGGAISAAYQVLQARSGARFLLVSVHLASPRGRTYDAARGNETLSLLRQASAYAHRVGVTSIVYGGDFNTYLGEWRTNNVSGATMLNYRVSDAVTVAPAMYNMSYNSFNSYYRKPPRSGHSLDHIYATNGVALTTAGQLLRLSHGKFYGTIPSDHNPVDSYVDIPYTP